MLSFVLVMSRCEGEDAMGSGLRQAPVHRGDCKPWVCRWVAVELVEVGGSAEETRENWLLTPHICCSVQ
jgi:hypothetical protein